MTNSQTSEVSSRNLAGKIILPLFLLSTLLLVVTAFAAWSVHQAKDEAARVVRLSLQRADAVHDLENAIHDLRGHLFAYMRTHDRRHLQAVLGMRDQTEQYVLSVERLFITQDGQTVGSGLRQTYTRLGDGLTELNGESSWDAASSLLDEDVSGSMINLARQQRAQQLAAMESAIFQQNQMTRKTTLSLIGLGALGVLAGLSLGCLITKRVRSSLLRLEVPVRDAAGQLSQVVGPISLSADDGSASLEQQLDNVAQQVGTVVERLQISQREQLRTDQMTAVGQLAAGVAHELRNPLTAMKTIIQTARQGSGELDDRDMEVLESEMTRLNDSIQSFLDYARPPTLERRVFDICEVIESAVKLVSARAAQQRIDIQFEPSESSIALNADFDRLRQVVVNLLLNAFDAMPDGGNVRMLSRLVGPNVVFTVSDTGTGIAPEFADRLFEPFMSSKEAGSGLGLSVCKQIVEDHNGTIEARSGDDGAEFTVTLPIASEVK
jgi:signal transduction histidine kinase